jgi:outer membrane protein OmpA-like peptidoglycan-associated protein
MNTPMNTSMKVSTNTASGTSSIQSSALRRLSLGVAVALLAACAGAPKGPSPELQRLLSEVDRLQGDTRVAPYADTELKRADRAVQVLVDEGRRLRPVEYQQRLYVADKLVQIAEAEGMGRYAEARGLELGRERERLVAEARRLELERARGETASARMAAADARSIAERERMAAEQARRDSRKALSEAEQAKLAAADSEAIARMERERAAAALSGESDARLNAAIAQSDAELARAAAQRARADAAQAQANNAQSQAELEKLRAQMAELQTQTTERGLVVTLGDVLFELDRAELKPGGQRTLDKLVSAVQTDADVELLVEGHTDSTGSRDYNMDLSERRAASVKQYLQSRGVAAERIQSAGLGPDFPVAVNTTEAGRQQNRRVEVVLRNPVALSQLD